MVYRFDNYTFDSDAMELKRDGTPIALAYQPATLLLALLRRAPELADRQWLRSEIWSDRTIVEFDQGLNACVRQLRAALNESAAQPRYIETLPKRGYRFGVEVGRQSVPSLLPKLGVGLIGLAVVVIAIWSLGSLREAKTSSAAPSLQVLPVVETSAKGEVAVPWLQYGLRLAVVDRLSTLQPDQLVTVGGQSLWVDQASRRLPSEADYRLQMAVGDGAQHRSLTARLSRSNAAGAAHTLTTTLQSNDSAGLRSAADQVAQWVVDSLGIGGLAPVPEQTDLDPELVSLLLRARQQRQLNRPDNLRLALAHYLEVLEHAPDAHEARAGKAFVQSVLAGQSGFPVNQTYQAAWAETEKLHANAYVSVDTLLVRGFILLYHQWDIAAALRQFDAAVERAPGHAVARAWRAAALAADGQLDSALDDVTSAVRMDPLALSVVADWCWYLNSARKADEAAKACQLAQDSEPGHYYSLINLVLAHQQMGDAETVTALLSKLIDRLSSDEGNDLSASDVDYCSLADALDDWIQRRPFPLVEVAAANAQCGRYQRTAELLVQARSGGESGYLFYALDRRFELFRKSPHARPFGAVTAPIRPQFSG